MTPFYAGLITLIAGVALFMTVAYFQTRHDEKEREEKERHVR